jgi:hypothetical protein
MSGSSPPLLYLAPETLRFNSSLLVPLQELSIQLQEMLPPRLLRQESSFN